MHLHTLRPLTSHNIYSIYSVVICVNVGVEKWRMYLCMFPYGIVQIFGILHTV